MVSVNVSRAAGPAIAGFVIAAWGVPPVFALNAALTTVLAGVLLLWRRPPTDRGERERFLPALRAGGRYVRHEPVIRTILLRFVTFVFPAGAVWALLPLIASRQLGLAASGYGIMFAALGAGAVVGALGLGTLKRHLSSNTILAIAAGLFAAAFAGLACTSSLWVAIPLLVVCGFGWASTVATITSELQLFVPGWVRARALGVLLMVFLGTQAVTAPLWGLVTARLGLRVDLADLRRPARGQHPDGRWSSGSPTARTWTVPRWPIGTPHGSPSDPTVPARSPCRSATRSTPTSKLPSSPRWSPCDAPGSAPEPSDGICTASGRTRTCSSSSSTSPAGTNTNANTTNDSPPKTKPSSKPHSPTSSARHSLIIYFPRPSNCSGMNADNA